MKLIFATNNEHKVNELNRALPVHIEVISLRKAGIEINIPEPYDTLRKNAAEKARVIYKLTQTNCFSEDTGLEVRALGGEPGVHSARYAGEGRSEIQNINKLLLNLENKIERNARFRTVICLIVDDKEHYFEGICEGRIGNAPVGAGGFGYDPIFIPDGSEKSFAQMDVAEKNQFSHRRKAAAMMVTFLNELI